MQKCLGRSEGEGPPSRTNRLCEDNIKINNEIVNTVTNVCVS